MMKKPANRYSQIIERIFRTHFRAGMTEVPFRREELEQVAATIGIKLPKNLGDAIYSFRYRAALPNSIQATAPAGRSWIIRPAGRSLYKFALVASWSLAPNGAMLAIKIPDATPGIIALYSMNDEQALLAKLRYNRLIDIFTGLTCYSLQNHLRAFVPDVGQVETDELYVGVDKRITSCQ